MDEEEDINIHAEELDHSNETSEEVTEIESISEMSNIYFHTEQEKRGWICRVSMVNFMCHSNLTIRLGPRINLIMGRNGSGKSTILTAISTCLGGRASNTNRGPKLSSLIKEGEERGLVAVEISNDGEFAYEPEKYGKSIIVERVMSKTANGYRIKDSKGKTVSTKRQDLDKILDAFYILIDNPFTVLTQDMARSFLASSSAEAKFEHFFKALQFDKILAYQEETNDNIQLIKNDLLMQKDTKILQLKTRWRQARRELDKFNKSRQAMIELADLKAIVSWERVREQQRFIDDCMQQMKDYGEAIRLTEEDQSSSDAKVQAIQEQKESLNRKITSTEASAVELRNQLKDLKQEFSKMTIEIRDMVRDKAAIDQNVEKTIHRITSTNSKLEELTSKGSENYDAAKRLKVEKQREVRNRITEIKRQIAEKTEEEDNSLRNIAEADNLESSISRINRQITAIDVSIRATSNSIVRLQQGERQPFSGYHVDMPKIVHDIERIAQNGGFHSKPIGPIGSFMKLKNAEWSPILETIMNNSLDGFIVFSERDREALGRVFNNYRVKPPVFVRTQDLFSYEHSMPDRNLFTTILDVLEFRNEFVKRLIIDVHRAEGTILFSGREEGERAMEHQPPQVTNCFALDRNSRSNGFKIGGRVRGAAAASPINGYNGETRIKMASHQQEMAALNAAIQEKKGRRDELIKERTAIQQEMKAIREEHSLLASAIRALRKNRSALETEDENLRIELERDERQENVEAERALRDELETLDEADKRYKDQLVEVSAQIAVKTSERNKLKEEADEKNLRYVKLEELKTAQEEEKEKKQSELARIQDSRANFDTIIAGLQHKLRTETEKKEEHEKQRDERRAYAIEDTGVEQEIALPTGTTPQSIVDRMNELAVLVRQIEEENGMTQEDASTEADNAGRLYHEATENYKRMKSDYTAIVTGGSRRKTTYDMKSRQTFFTLMSNFKTNLQERGFEGELKINQESHKLQMFIAPKGGENRDVLTLSGGEKSYCQIALLLALWEEMNSRLVALDEFDVFMDKVNRRISLSMVMENLRRRKYVQSIFITPQEMELGAVKIDEDVNIHRMADPRS